MGLRPARRCASSRVPVIFQSSSSPRAAKKIIWKPDFKVAAMTTSPSPLMEPNWSPCCRATWANKGTSSSFRLDVYLSLVLSVFMKRDLHHNSSAERLGVDVMNDLRLTAARKRLAECSGQTDAIEAVREIVSNFLGSEEMALFDFR